MSSEARTVRPFTGLELFESALERASLHFGTETCQPDESIRSDLDSHEFKLRPIELAWAKDDEEFESFKDDLREGGEDLDIELSKCSLIVVADTTYLKEAEVLFSRPLDAISSLERIVSLATTNKRPAPLEAWRHGFRVDAHILLNRSIEPSPLRPWRKGTWFSRVRFEVKTTHSDERLFRPRPLDDANRERLQLPDGTTRFVELGEHDPFEPYEDQAEQPELYIDEDLLSELNASASSSEANQAVQLELALYFISTIIQKASRRDNIPRFEDISGSLIARIIELCVGSTTDEERMRVMYNRIRKRSPEHVIAWAEDRIGIRSALISNVKSEK
jgi:hypothetical protein